MQIGPQLFTQSRDEQRHCAIHQALLTIKMRGQSQGEHSATAAERDQRRQVAQQLQRAFPLAGRGEFDDLLSALDKVERKN